MRSQSYWEAGLWGTDGNVPHNQPSVGPIFCPDSAIRVMLKVTHSHSKDCDDWNGRNLGDIPPNETQK